MSNATEKNKLIPPLTFRLYQSVKFNRPIDKDKDFISPGGYELKMKDEDGTEKSIAFDFDDYEGGVDDNDPKVINCMQKNPDYSEFPELNTVTEYMLHNVTEVVEWFIYTGEPGETENPLVPVEVIEAEFEIINDSTRRDITPISIPITTAIKPFSNFSDELDKNQKE